MASFGNFNSGTFEHRQRRSLTLLCRRCRPFGKSRRKLFRHQPKAVRKERYRMILADKSNELEYLIESKRLRELYPECIRYRGRLMQLIDQPNYQPLLDAPQRI